MLCASCWEATGSTRCTRCGAPTLLHGRYRLEAIVAEGAEGFTWRAVQVGEGRTVAIKEVPLWGRSSGVAWDRIRREADVLGQLHHPGIPAFHEAFSAGTGRHRSLYIVQEYIDGPTLAEERDRRRLSETEVLGLLEELLGILAYLHDRSPPVIHRDLKPDNVLRASDGRLVLVDFGSVRATLPDPELGGTTIAGTFGYMAPEQFHGDASPATDLYGLGALAVALLTRRAPCTLLEDPSRRLRWRPHTRVSAELAALLDSLLHPDPRRRPPSAHEVRRWVRDLRDPRSATRRTMPPLRPSRIALRDRSPPWATPDLREARIDRPEPRRLLAATTALADIARQLSLGAAFLALAFGLVAAATVVSSSGVSSARVAEVPTDLRTVIAAGGDLAACTYPEAATLPGASLQNCRRRGRAEARQ